MKIRRSAAVAAGVITAAAALVLSGCTSPSPESTSGGESEEWTPVEINVGLAGIHSEPVFIAIQEGYFEEEGLIATPVPAQDAGTAIAQLVSGEVDFAIASWTTVVTSTAQGVPLVMIGGNGWVDPESDAWGAMVLPDSPYQTVADLEGKNIATNAVRTGADVPYLLAAEAAGLNPDEVIEVAVPYPGIIEALQNGVVDAILVPDPFYSLGKAAGLRSLGNFQTEFTAELPTTSWTVMQEFADANPEVVERFQRAMAKAHDFYNDPANLEAVKAVSAEILGVEPDRVPPLTVMKIEVHEDAMNQSISDLERLGFVENPKPLDQILWSGAPRA